MAGALCSTVFDGPSTNRAGASAAFTVPRHAPTALMEFLVTLLSGVISGPRKVSAMRFHGSLMRSVRPSVAGAVVLALGCLTLLAQSKPPASRAAAARRVTTPRVEPIKVLFI